MKANKWTHVRGENLGHISLEVVYLSNEKFRGESEIKENNVPKLNGAQVKCSLMNKGTKSTSSTMCRMPLEKLYTH